MKGVSNSNTIHETFQFIRDTSFNEKRQGVSAEEEINGFLDHVLEFQKLLNEKSTRIEGINQRIESLTWLNNISPSGLKEINDLIASGRDLYSILIRQYLGLNVIVKNEIAKEAVERFKSAIDDLKEIVADIESVFFFLPQMPDFIDTTRELSLIK